MRVVSRYGAAALLYLDVFIAADVPDVHAPIAAAHCQIVAVITDCGCQ